MIEEPIRLHLQLHEAQGAVVQHHHLDRQPRLLERQEVPISMAKPPSPAMAITWRFGKAA
jgi:hypothetical protein